MHTHLLRRVLITDYTIDNLKHVLMLDPELSSAHIEYYDVVKFLYNYSNGKKTTKTLKEIIELITFIYRFFNNVDDTTYIKNNYDRFGEFTVFDKVILIYGECRFLDDEPPQDEIHNLLPDI